MIVFSMFDAKTIEHQYRKNRKRNNNFHLYLYNMKINSKYVLDLPVKHLNSKISRKKYRGKYFHPLVRVRFLRYSTKNLIHTHTKTV